MKLNDIRDEAYAVAKSKGWHDEGAERATVSDRIALMISELAEALEEYRNNRDPTKVYFVTHPQLDPEPAPCSDYDEAMKKASAGTKPEGIGIELADVVIRIGDAAGAWGLDFGELDLSTADRWWPYRFSRAFLFVTRLLLSAGNHMIHEAPEQAAVDLGGAALAVARWSKTLGSDIERCIEIKTAYNKTRSHRHGGKRI